MVFIKTYKWKGIDRYAAIDAVLEVLDTIGNVAIVVVFNIYPFIKEFKRVLEERGISLKIIPYQQKTHLNAINIVFDTIADYVIVINRRDFDEYVRDKDIKISSGGNIDWGTSNIRM